MTVPDYLPYYTMGGSTAIIAALVLGLNAALHRAGWAEARRRRAIVTASAALSGWFAIAVVMALLGAYRATPEGIPTIPFGILVPILIGILLLWRSQGLAHIVEAVPQPWLVGVQFYRALGMIFLVLWAGGKLPGLFAWPAGAGDVAVGLAAPFVASAFARDQEGREGTVAWWNILGLADLVVAVGTGFLTSPSPFQLFAFDSPNELVSIFPLVLVPTFLVPLSVLMHIASLRKLAAESPAIEAGCDLTHDPRPMTPSPSRPA